MKLVQIVIALTLIGLMIFIMSKSCEPLTKVLNEKNVTGIVNTVEIVQYPKGQESLNYIRVYLADGQSYAINKSIFNNDIVAGETYVFHIQQKSNGYRDADIVISYEKLK